MTENYKSLIKKTKTVWNKKIFYKNLIKIEKPYFHFV